MKLYFLITICCLVAASIANTSSQDDFLRESFKAYKTKYGKVYTSLKENNMRFRIYHENLKMIEKHNAEYKMGLHTYYLGVNQFIDWTQEEKRKYNNAKYDPMPEVINATISTAAAAPDNLDWRKNNYVTKVQNQGGCGSCWTFAAAGGIEGAQAKKHLQIINMSEQEILDCDQKSQGCEGGYINTAFEAVKAVGGEVFDVQYPYEAVKRQCRAAGKQIAAKVTGFQYVGDNEQALKEAVWQHGPIPTLINSQPVKYYQGGIFTGYCPHNIDHAVLVVGYGVENGMAYWLIKNSWGVEWGESGYLRLGRNMGQLCGISVWSAYPIVA